MKILLFSGCKVPYYAPYHETSGRRILEHFGFTFQAEEFNCCGYPIRFLDFKAFLYASARNIALAGRHGLALVCLCKCCYGTLRYADQLLRQHESLRQGINLGLKAEGLQYVEGIEIKHFLNLFFEDMEWDTLKKQIVRPLSDLKVAAHYGCHILRPHDVVDFDDPVKPTKFEKLIEVTGAKTVDWPLRLLCCGEPLWEKNNELSAQLTRNKLEDAAQAGADLLCVGCTHCQLQFDRVGGLLPDAPGLGRPLPSILYSQLLGWSLGWEAAELGLSQNQIERLPR